MKIRLTAAALAIVLTTADAADAQQRKRVRSSETAFFATMQVGDPDVIVGKNGPLSLLVRCILNGNETAIRLVMRSTVDGWAVAQAGTAGQINAINLPAGERDITGISQSAP